MFLRYHLQARIRTLGGRIAVTILSLRFFIFQYGIVYKLNVKGDSTSLTVFTFSQKLSANFRLLLRVIQGVSFLLALAGLAAAVKFTDLSIADIAIAWKSLMEKIRLCKSIRSIALLYHAGMGMLIFIPIALSSWFPFVSTFQTRLMFNQAFARGLEISLVLAGNNPNTGI
ncbi:hypothetical protein ACFX2I_028765 [Malus domestica]